MKDDQLQLSDRERRAIEAIGRELDREFGAALAEPGPARVEPSRLPPAVPARPRMTGLHVALAAGSGALSAAVILAFATWIASVGPVGVAPWPGEKRGPSVPTPASSLTPVPAAGAGRPTAAAHRATASLAAPAHRRDAERGRRPNPSFAGRRTTPGPLIASAAELPARSRLVQAP